MVGILDKIKAYFGSAHLAHRGFTAVQTAITTVAAVATAGTVGTVAVTSANDVSSEVEQAAVETTNNLLGTFMIKGDVYGKAANAGPNAAIGQISFNVALACNDGSIDFTPPLPSAENNGLAGEGSANIIVISFTDEDQLVQDLYWTVQPLGKDDGDMTLEGGELFQITIGGSALPAANGGNLIDALEPDLGKDTRFMISLGAPQGPTVSFDGQTPGSIKKLNCFR